jgi:hypothetical protein
MIDIGPFTQWFSGKGAGSVGTAQDRDILRQELARDATARAGYHEASMQYYAALRSDSCSA